MNIIENDKKYIANTYARAGLVVKSGKGSLIYDENGKEYIDMGAGIAVNTFGACDEVWKNAVIDQINELQHISNLYYTVPQVKLAKQLCIRSGMKKVFFSNSGAEANECMIKTARKYSFDKYGEGRNVIVTLKNSFHGRTVTTLAATGQDSFHQYFMPFTQGFEYAAANDLEGMKKTLENPNICAVMIELVQGEGGVIALEKEFVEGVYKLCREKDILLAIDEVQTGNGRTGKLYAYMNYEIEPDIVSTAKGLAGGLPFGATLFSEKTENTLCAGMHGSTFGGNPVCAAAALSTLERIDSELLSDVKAKSEYIIKELSGAKGIKSISGMGLMLGIETEKDAKSVLAQCLENGVIVLTAKTKIRLVPPLNIPFELLEKAISVIKEAAAQ